MSPATAEKLGVESQDDGPAEIQRPPDRGPGLRHAGPGRRDVALSAGLRPDRRPDKVGGSTADGVAPVGFNAYRPADQQGDGFVGTGRRVEPTGRRIELATAQDHFAIDTVGLRERIKRVPASWSVRRR